MPDVYCRSSLALQIVEESADAFVALDKQFRFIFANAAAERLLGARECELLGRSQWDGFPANLGSPLDAALRRAVDQRAPVNLETFFDSAQKWFEMQATPSEEGGLVVRFRDITERKRAEEAVQAERQRFSNVLDELPAYLVLLSPDYHVPFANRFFRERFGESGGRRCYEYLFNRTAPCEVCETYSVLKTNAPHRWEWTGPDGRNYDIYDFPFRDTDGSILIMEVGFDITERKRAEAAVAQERQRVAEVLEKLPVMVCLLAPDHQVPFVNARFREHFGESGGRPCFEYRFQRTEPCPWCEAFTPLQTHAPHRWELAAPDGSYYDVHNFPFTDPDGSPLILEMDVDISEPKRAEAEIAKHREHLQEVVKERTGQLEAANAELHAQIAERERMEQRLATDLAALTRIHALSKELLEAGELQPLLQDIMDAAVAIAGAERGTLQLIEGDSLRIVAHHGHQTPFLEFFAFAEGRASVCGEVMKRGERVIVEDVESSPLFAGTPSLPVLRGAGVRAVQSTPMLSRTGALLGVLTTQWSFPHLPDEHDLWRIDLLARQAADLIEHGRAQATLRRLAQFPEENPNPVLRVGADGKLLYANSPGRSCLAEIEGAVDQSIPADVHALVERARREQRVVEAELASQRGRTFWFSAAQPPGENYVNLYVRDITERKRAEEALRQAVDRYERQVRLFDSIASTTPDFVYLFDLQGRFLYANRGLLEVWGMQLPHVVGKTCRELGYEQWHHDMHMREIAQVIETKRPIKGEVPFKAPLTGIFGVYEYIFTPVLGPGGEVELIAGTTRDVTERKHSEEALRESDQRLRRAQEIAHLGSWELDLLDNRLSWSDEVYRIFGLQPREFGATYAAFLEAVHPEDRAAVDAAYSGSLRDNRDAYDIEHRVIRKATGEIRFVHERCQHVRDEAGRIVRSLGMVHDVTERKRAEERLRHAQKLESIGVLAGGIAHDFNNLLTTILGNASLLQLDVPANGEQLQAIIESSEKAAALTRQLLAYAGKGQFQITDFDVSRLIRSSPDLIRVSIPRNVEMDLDVPRNLPAIRGDSSQIQQLVMNLVINAAEAVGDRKDGKVCISACARNFNRASASGIGSGLAPGRYIVLTVRDNGCGMAEETKAKIFDPFFTTKFTGRGLGLAAVHGILTAHKGAITVETAVGQGSTFTVYLPCADGRAGAGTKAMTASNTRGATVLIVDDEEHICALTKAALERLRYGVLVAHNGQEALDILGSRDDVDLVMLDIVMPVVGGVEAFADMRRRWPNLTFLVTSGHSQQEAHRLGMPADLPFLAKPFTMQMLAAAVDKALKARRHDEE
jgi:PAS domain S-box-containing protein